VTNISKPTDIPCTHCINPHGKLVCDCGYTHNEHVIGGGCIARDAKGKLINCDRYSQKLLNTVYGKAKTVLDNI
jgi:hypothetical protein